jgi:hypothetical protein
VGNQWKNDESRLIFLIDGCFEKLEKKNGCGVHYADHVRLLAHRIAMMEVRLVNQLLQEQLYYVHFGQIKLKPVN